mgnify:CR=1 FL=1
MRIPSYTLIPAYVVFGPPLGASALWAMTYLPSALLATLDRGVDAQAWTSIFKLLGTYAMFSYLLGLLPALGAGIAHAVIRRRSGSSRVRIASAGLTGAALTAALLLVGANAKAQDSLTLFAIAAGGISALLMALLLEGIGARSSRDGLAG